MVYYHAIMRVYGNRAVTPIAINLRFISEQ
jgi:hypothetical protein